MTTTDTTEILSALQQQLDGLAATLRHDEQRRDTKRRLIQRTAQTAGRENGIGPALDDLLVEFGMEGRPTLKDVYAYVEYTQSITRRNLTEATGMEFFHSVPPYASHERMRLSEVRWRRAFTAHVETPYGEDDGDCVCPEGDTFEPDDPALRDRLPHRETEVPEGVTWTIGVMACSGAGCRHGGYYGQA